MGSNNDLPTKIVPVVTSVTCPTAGEKKFLSVRGIAFFPVFFLDYFFLSFFPA